MKINLAYFSFFFIKKQKKTKERNCTLNVLCGNDSWAYVSQPPISVRIIKYTTNTTPNGVLHTDIRPFIAVINVAFVSRLYIFNIDRDYLHFCFQT